MTIAPAPPHGRRMPHRRRLIWIAIAASGVVLVSLGVALLVRTTVIGGSPRSTVVQGSGIAITQTRHLPKFSSLELAGGNNITVSVGGKQTVTVRGDDNLVELITTEVRGRQLVLAQTRSFTTKSPMSVAITVPSLTSSTISGFRIVKLEGVRSRTFTVLGRGGAILTASGTVKRLKATVAGSGDLRPQRLTARDVTARVSGSGRLQVEATRSLQASVLGSGVIFYGGDPSHLTKHVNGVGVISPR